MEIIKIIGVCLLGTMIAVMLKEYKPVLSVCVCILTSATVLLYILAQISYTFDVIAQIASRLSIEDTYIKTIIRIIGISYLSRFASEVCRDAGQASVAQNVELCAKVLIVVTSIPVLSAVLNLLIGILPG